MITATITINLEELVQEVPARKIIRAYGAGEILGQFTVNELIKHFDTDSLLEAIGEEKIKDFLALSKKEIA